MPPMQKYIQSFFISLNPTIRLASIFYLKYNLWEDELRKMAM